jgi:[ribosomal protein S5]-alanine N-acetyltransferase
MPSFPALPADLSDDVVVLRPFGLEDAAAAFAACRDPLIARYTTFPTPQREEQTRAWILAQPGQRERGEALDLAITRHDDGALLGAIGLGNWAVEHRRAAAGYWLAPWARGHGYAARALRLLTTWALGPPLGLRRLELLIDSGNEPSQRTAERAGYVYEGVLKSYLEAKGRGWDVVVYARVS